MVGRGVAGSDLMVAALFGLTLAAGCGGQRADGTTLDVMGDVRAAPRRTMDATGESGAPEAKPTDGQGEHRREEPVCVATTVPDELCTKNTECASGWCVLHLGEKICTQACLEECPEGWTCAEVAGAGSDLVFACLSMFPSLCLPCDSSSKCSSQDRCAAYPEGAGGFCATPCGNGSDCPCGYECTEMPTLEGDTKQLCAAAGFACECTQHAVLNKLGTPCTVSNGYGSCAGWRGCSADGLTSCTAPQPGVEVCDGEDNDCDGATDEEDVCDECLCGDGACSVSGCGECWYNCTGADGESCCTCAVDCAVCGNGTCDPGEGPTKCAVDCCGACGDGICKGGECGEDAKGNGGYCAVDCAEPTCGNGVCEPGEDDDAADDGIADCPEDCGKYACGNGVCEPGEDPQECPEDCAPGCGDCQCAGGESYLTCPVDCGYCGDGYCIDKCSYIPEDASLCPLDCACEPACAGKECGSDGCGGSCGTCPTGNSCQMGQCLICADGTPDLPNGLDDDCDGKVDENAYLLWSMNGSAWVSGSGLFGNVDYTVRAVLGDTHWAPEFEVSSTDGEYVLRSGLPTMNGQ